MQNKIKLYAAVFEYLQNNFCKIVDTKSHAKYLKIYYFWNTTINKYSQKMLWDNFLLIWTISFCGHHQSYVEVKTRPSFGPKHHTYVRCCQEIKFPMFCFWDKLLLALKYIKLVKQWFLVPLDVTIPELTQYLLLLEQSRVEF